MKNKFSQFFPLEIQFFAEDGGEANTEQSGEEANGGTEQMYTEADVQKLIADKLAEAETNWTQKLEDAKSEAEKLAKLSKEEKAAHEEQKRIAALEEREAAVARRELEAETLKLLSDKQIPDSVLGLVIGEDADETKKNVDTFKKIFDAAVQTAVESRMAGTTPRTGSGSSGNHESSIAEQFKKALGGM
ncbi:MAG TPA: DUF4355 domain-containing protein [Firmicutes bacterium]|nr:DUF4355 domain-containing protein [Bacillota bacterium]